MKRIYRSRTDKKIAGIFGGIAELYNLDPSLLRLLAVFACLLTGFLPLIIAYLVGWLIMPKGPATVDLPTPPIGNKPLFDTMGSIMLIGGWILFTLDIFSVVLLFAVKAIKWAWYF